MRLFIATLFATLGLCSLLITPVALVSVTGCTTSQQRKTVNTIATLGYTVDESYKAYLDLVVQRKVSTNSVPAVSQSYSAFQAAFNSALMLAALNTNALPSVDLQNAASQLQLAIKAAKSQ